LDIELPERLPHQGAFRSVNMIVAAIERVRRNSERVGIVSG
jgi:hypothetical protein